MNLDDLTRQANKGLNDALKNNYFSKQDNDNQNYEDLLNKAKEVANSYQNNLGNVDGSSKSWANKGQNLCNLLSGYAKVQCENAYKNNLEKNVDENIRNWANTPSISCDLLTGEAKSLCEEANQNNVDENLKYWATTAGKACNSLSGSAKTLCEKAYQDNMDNAVNEKFNQWANMERNACEIFYGGASKECERSNYLWARDCFKNCTKSLANSETGYTQCMLQCEDLYANSKNDATTTQVMYSTNKIVLISKNI